MCDHPRCPPPLARHSDATGAGCRPLCCDPALRGALRGGLAAGADAAIALPRAQVDANHFVGLEITVPDRKKRLSAADWLCAASIAHEKKYITLVDHENRDLEYYKRLRREACRNFFYAAMVGLLLAVWANEVMHSHGRKNSFQSLSLQTTMMCSSGLAVYFLCDYYHAELCVARLKGWKLAPGFCPRALKGANLWNQFLRDLLILVPQPLPFLFFTFTVHDSGLGRDSTYPVSVVLLVCPPPARVPPLPPRRPPAPSPPPPPLPCPTDEIDT